MRKILLSVLLCTLVLTGCNEAEVDEKTANVEQDFVSEDTENTESTEDSAASENSDTAVLSDEEIVDIFLDNVDLWKEEFDSDYTPNAFGYFMLDLDFDGVCELVAYSVEGSGFFSYNEYYKLNLEDKTVIRLDDPEEREFSSGNDWDIVDEVKLLRSTEDNSLFYYCLDYIRGGYKDYDSCFRTFFVKDGQIAVEDIFYEYHYERDEDPEQQTHIYVKYENGERVYFDKDEYEAKKAEYFTENVDMNLVWKIIDGFEFQEADEEGRRAMLLESYSAFSYDGF